MDKEPKKYLNTIEKDKESIEWLLISENESPRQKKRKGRNSSFSVIHFPLPPLIKLSSHLVRSSRIQFQIKPRFHQGSPLSVGFYRFIPVMFPTVPPSILLLLREAPFSFVFRLSVASSQQGTKSSKVLTVERFVIRSRVSPPLYIHHRSYPFQSSFHASSRAVCFLSVSPSPFHRSIPLLFALPPLR